MDTRTQLLDAAEELFAERGYNGTSIRAVTNLAGANLAAVGYHFGSKAELLAAVARRVIEPINNAQREGLDRLLGRTAEPTVAELVEAFTGPMFDGMPAGDERSVRRSRLLVTILGDPADEVRNWMGPVEDAVRDRYLEAFRRALPELPIEELWFRIKGVLAVTTVDRLEPQGDAARRWAVTFLAAALSAPPTAPD
ncbi:TetR/AcrR family transcriptional regulator [Dactylosporangium sp. NPDC051541]|uniref:TetR/AcrR family transcriptional regulator n=1 Tax=Dactylosporangium sp. NPDC051541 TaxID=3363977 RepID=UPI0037B7F726